jgi:hypothetical protein
MTTTDDVLTRTPSLRLGPHQEQVLRRWPIERIRPKSVALGIVSLFAEIDALRKDHGAAAELARVKECAELARSRALLILESSDDQALRDEILGFLGEILGPLPGDDTPAEPTPEGAEHGA